MIFEAYYEIAAFVICKKTDTRRNKLLLGRNACLGYFDVSQMFFFMLYTQKFRDMSYYRPRPAQEK